MAKQALRNPQHQSSPGEAEKDPIEDALKLNKALIADSMIANTLAKSKAETVKAEADAVKAQAEARKAEGGADKGEGGADSGFKLKGSFNMGEFNFLELLNSQRAELQLLKTDAEKQAQSQAGISDDLRERLHAKDLEVLTTGFNYQFQMMNKVLESQGSKGSFMDQYNMTKELAGQIGFVAPGAQTSDLTTQLELKKMEFNQIMELRKMAREEKHSDRQFQLDIAKAEDERQQRKIDQDRAAKRDDMIAGAPALVGRAIGKALAEGGGEVAEGISGTPGKKGEYSVDVASGAVGKMDCPKPGCGEAIGIGPTARAAVCAKCGTRVQIKRTAGAEGGAESTAEVGAEAEEE